MLEVEERLGMTGVALGSDARLRMVCREQVVDLAPGEHLGVLEIRQAVDPVLGAPIRLFLEWAVIGPGVHLAVGPGVEEPVSPLSDRLDDELDQFSGCRLKFRVQTALASREDPVETVL
jgi:hypothetical protein